VNLYLDFAKRFGREEIDRRSFEIPEENTSEIIMVSTTVSRPYIDASVVP
jgi:hypothetical protein